MLASRRARRRLPALVAALLSAALVAAASPATVPSLATEAPETPPNAADRAAAPVGHAREIAATPADGAATTRAGVASVDASWHVGAGGGQFAETQPAAANGEYVDPFLHATKKRPARGIQSRILTRALVVEDTDGDRVAVVGNDLYLPNDLVNRRVAQLLEQHDLAVQTGLTDGVVTGIGEDNLAVTVSHNHNSPFYSTPSWGTWIFQDVFDLRFFEYIAGRMAQAVIDATADMRPVRIGAATVPFNEIQAHTIGPKIADDGTPAGQPYAHTTGQLTVVRVDDLTDPAHPAPYANWVTLGLHPEWTWGYELFSGDITHTAMRIIDRELGTTTVMSQRETGSSGPHKDLRVHEPDARREFQESGWQQLEVGARHWADAVHRAYAAIENEEEPASFDPHDPRTDGPPIELVPFDTDLDVEVASARFAPPTMRPVPGLSNCNTASMFHGEVGIPVLGLPDCNDDSGEVGRPLVETTPVDERAFYDQLKEQGVPVPEAIWAPVLTGVEETAAIHLMAVKLGDIAATFCPCEQFTDTALNIQSRLDRTPDNVWRGFDWTTQRRPNGEPFCTQNGDTTWTCADPRSFREAPPWPDLEPITDLEYRRMRAQIRNDADGWEDVDNADRHAFGEAEPSDPELIKGNYTHREVDEYGGSGYGLTIAVGMSNDYFGYTPSYRDMRAFDHYRKALNGLGLHGSDYLATRLVKLAASLNGGRAVEPSPQDLAYQAESARARSTSQAIGETARAYTAAYEQTLPADGGEPVVVEQPADITRFGGTSVRFVGGSSYTDLPQVRVERFVDGDWHPFADQTGEVPTEARFPTPQQLPAFHAGEFAWEWTATFEASVSQIPLPDASGNVTRATPPGAYRFVIDGQRRASAGDVVEPYSLVSDTFTVVPWDGLTVESFEVTPDGDVRVAAGPSTSELFDEHTFTFGPIDYPDAWAWDQAMTSVADQRAKTEKGSFGSGGERVFYRYRPGSADDQAYCIFCRFHPWQDTGDPAVAYVTVERVSGRTERVAATPAGDGVLTASPQLRPGDRISVAPGDLRDPWGNTNRVGSAVLTVAPAGR